MLPFTCSVEDIRGAGLSCSEEEPCPVYLELTTVEPLGSKLFALGNVHSATVTLYSVLLGSEDFGKTWREAHRRILGAALDHVQFVDFATGWISGQLLYPLTQDPFLLITSDGGKTWRRRTIFDEHRLASVQQLWFRSKDQGSLVIDRGQGSEGNRYELYESPNAGESWAIREASDTPIRLRMPAAAEPEWRVRADGPTQSFRIERRQGERWSLASAFSVPLGDCKPPAPVGDDTPPEPAAEAPPPPPPPAVRAPARPGVRRNRK